MDGDAPAREPSSTVGRAPLPTGPVSQPPPYGNGRPTTRNNHPKGDNANQNDVGSDRAPLKLNRLKTTSVKLGDLLGRPAEPEEGFDDTAQRMVPFRNEGKNRFELWTKDRDAWRSILPSTRHRCISLQAQYLYARHQKRLLYYRIRIGGLAAAGGFAALLAWMFVAGRSVVFIGLVSVSVFLAGWILLGIVAPWAVRQHIHSRYADAIAFDALLSCCQTVANQRVTLKRRRFTRSPREKQAHRWESEDYKRELVRRLERAARYVETRFRRQARGRRRIGDRKTWRMLQEHGALKADGIRDYKLWVLIPRSDTQQQLLQALEWGTIAAGQGDWNVLPTGYKTKTTTWSALRLRLMAAAIAGVALFGLLYMGRINAALIDALSPDAVASIDDVLPPDPIGLTQAVLKAVVVTGLIGLISPTAVDTALHRLRSSMDVLGTEGPG